MPLFVMTALDKPGVLDERMKHRPDHVAYLKTQEAIIGKCGEPHLIKPSLKEFEEHIGSKLQLSTH